MLEKSYKQGSPRGDVGRVQPLPGKKFSEKISKGGPR